jgi:hypothetical protein
MDKQAKNLLIFFVATFVWTWAFYTPIAAGGHNPYPWTILLIFGGMGLSVIGVLMVLLHLFQCVWKCLNRSSSLQSDLPHVC